MSLFLSIFLAFLAVSILVKFWLSQRQMAHILSHRGHVPDEFAEKIALHDHQKAADYSCSKIKTARLELVWDSGWLLLWTVGGGINYLNEWWLAFGLSSLTSGILVIFSVLLLSSLLGLPFSIYQTFVIEQKFGFNNTTWQTWMSDLVKTGLLVLVIGTPLITAILWLMNQAGDLWWLYAWLLWMAFTLFMIWAYPAFIAPLFNQFSPLDDESLKLRIETLLQRCGFQSNGVFVVDGSKRSSHGNAYFSGFGQNKRIVFYDTLLESLSAEEVEAVLAHELGHFKRNHIKKSMLMSGLMTLLGFWLLALLMNSDWFYSAFLIQSPSTHVALLLFMMVMPAFTYFISPLFSALSRKHEFEADEFAYNNSDYRSLISALVSLYRENASTLTPDPLHSVFYDSHPPASIRINHLKSLAGES